MQLTKYGGLTGSFLLLASGILVGNLPRDSRLFALRDALRLSDTQRHWTGWGLAVAGLVVLTAAWWSLRREAVRRESLPLVWRTVALWLLPVLVAPPLLSADGWLYVGNGWLLGHGDSPYVVALDTLPDTLRSAVSHRWIHTPSPYGPLAHLWGVLAAKTTSAPWLLLWWYRALAVLGLVLTGWAVPRLARRTGRDPVDASALVLASPWMIAQGVGGLHLDLITAGLGLVALVLTTPGRWRAGAVVAGLAVAVKVTGGAVLVGVALLSLARGAHPLRRLQRAGQVAVVALWVVVGLGLLTRTGIGWVHALTVPEGQISWSSLSWEVGRALPVLAPALKLLGGLTVLAVAGWAVVRGEPRPSYAIGVSGLLGLLIIELGPVAHYWYFLLAVPLLACVPLSRASAAACRTLVVVLGLAVVADPPTTPALHDLVVGARWALLVLPAVAWVVVRRTERREAREERLLPLTRS